MAKDRIVIPGIPKDAARVIIERLREAEDRLAQLERKGGRPGVVTTDTVAKVGELLNIEGPSGETITIVLPESTQRRRNARVTLAFRNSNPVRIVCVGGTVNGEAFVLNDRPGTYDATCDGLGGWYVQVGVSEEGSGAGGGGGGGGSVTFGVPGSVSLETAAAEGVATTAARSDHVHSTAAGTPVAIAMANAEGSAATFARSDHVHRDRIATGSEDGFLSRRVYANASSAKVGTTFMGVTVLAAPASFTAMSDFADGAKFRIGLAAAGGSGSCGSRGTATACSGSNPGGGAGAFRELWVSRAQLVTLLSAGNISVAIGLGGASVTGPSSSATSFTACTQGNNGSGPTTFGPWSCFQGGGGNGGGAAGSARAGGAGGGLLSAGGGGTTGTAATTGGAPLPIGAVATPTAAVNTSLFGGGGCIAASGTNGGTGNPSLFGGAGGSTNGSSASDPRNGGDSEHGAAGGGCGGFGNNGSGGAGGDGGLAGGRTSRATAGTASTGAGARTGGNGNDGADATDVWRGCGDGGAGGGCGGSTSGAATGGNGGNGGFPGGGGGGGGTGTTQAAANTSTGGNSGAGGDGLLIIESYA